ncbi:MULTISPECIES: enoyl-CoA hydratase/isomerase family protein [unclassified Pseudomonas]|uniref:enoyl-CoA hydratase/isomerase family protein n=1 Tax=unclassified Pseudomonas TaxID=196821 RepID=UPI000D3D2C81|nr:MULTISPECIES: enoyl-CoA hydratase/isomerase family protein [unclassified Pseudomonas]RAU47924.1 enoyl-CoA hydratase/isomerase family protein [Pseudomonas sp. RIT 409]RAU55382.1 enoyl-CoA hydratase/isomerase family protein [Pseudomonas sp. RIT 412]
MYSDDVTFRVEDGIATISLNRVSRHNALTTEMLRTIDRALEEIEHSPAVRVLTIRSTSPRFFCSGADINEWGDIDPERMGSQWIRTGNRVFRRLDELDIPTVAVLSASALGGGFELALACDLRYAATTASLGFPEAAVGAIPGWMGCKRLNDLVGPTRSRELVLLGTPIDAQRAVDWGLVNAAVAPEALEEVVHQACQTLKSRSPVAQSIGKRLLRIADGGDAELSHEFAASVCKATSDAVEGVRAFREKRPAIFSDRS